MNQHFGYIRTDVLGQSGHPKLVLECLYHSQDQSSWTRCFRLVEAEGTCVMVTCSGRGDVYSKLNIVIACLNTYIFLYIAKKHVTLPIKEKVPSPIEIQPVGREQEILWEADTVLAKDTVV